MGANEDMTRAAAVLRRGALLLPAVLLSAAWTASVAGVGGVTVAERGGEQRPAVPTAPVAPVAVPERKVAPPANLAQLSRATSRNSQTVVPASGRLQIPPVALAAYQRAAVVIGAADKDCGLAWPLVAAIGRVESDHGRTGGGALGDDGVAKPAIVGLRLDGKRGTALVSDTDGGRYDGDQAFDRAVGPMQFIPTTWGVVGVDADGDGIRDPQDVDDAALATAVYLCSGDIDLSRGADLRSAVHRYNRSDRYVDLVLSVMKAYAAGEGTPAVAVGYAVPPGSVATGGAQDGNTSATAHHAPPVDGKPSVRPTPVRQPQQPAPQPAPEVEPEPMAPRQPVVTVLARAQAVLTCTVRGLSQLLQPARFRACVEQLTKG